MLTVLILLLSYLLAQVGNLQTENAALHSRTSILEKVRESGVWERVVFLLCVAACLFSVRWRVAPPPSTHPHTTHANKTNQNQTTQPKQTKTTNKLTTKPKKVLDMRNEQIQVMQESKEVTQQFDDALDAPPLTLTAVGGQPISLTSDMLKELSPEQIYKIYQTCAFLSDLFCVFVAPLAFFLVSCWWQSFSPCWALATTTLTQTSNQTKHKQKKPKNKTTNQNSYIKELSARLVELNKGGDVPADVTTAVERLTREVAFLLMRLSVVRPIETRKFIAVSRQYLTTEAEAIAMWKAVVNSINLSDKQRSDVVSWKQLFMQKVGRLGVGVIFCLCVVVVTRGGRVFCRVSTTPLNTTNNSPLTTQTTPKTKQQTKQNKHTLTKQNKTPLPTKKTTKQKKVEPIVEERKKLNVQIQAHLPQESFHTRNAIT